MKILETNRLILREIIESDDQFMLDLLNQPSFIKYIGDRNVRTIEEAREFIEKRYRTSYAQNGFGLYAVELKAEFALNDVRASAFKAKEFAINDVKAAALIQNPKSKIQNQIGICGFVKRDSLPDADIGFAFLPQFGRKGLAFEAAEAVMKFGREGLGLERVLAITTQENESSIKLLEKLGFKFERLIKMPHETEQLKLFSFQ